MKPKLLDLFCCGGGASLGYEQAGFDVVGVDIEPQRNYQGSFVQADAFEYLSKHHKNFDAFHASPPCQAYSKSSMQFRLVNKIYAELIEPIRQAFNDIGKPFVIENVPGAPLENPIQLCGQMFGLRTYRHRLFETNWRIEQPFHAAHAARNAKMGRKPKSDEYIQYVGHFSGVAIVQEMTGLTWLNQYELAQSIPPQYAKFVGEQLLRELSI